MVKERETIIGIPTYFGNQMLTNCIASCITNISNARIYVYKNDIGFPKAANSIMESTNTDVILLNDDTIVITDIVKEMSELAYSDPKIGIVGGKALSHDLEHILNYGVFVAPNGDTAHKHFGQPRDSVGVEEQKSVEGSCLFIKREVIDTIGVFDTEYGMGYREEVDYCFRAREAGYKVVSCPTAEYIHLVSQTNSQLGIWNNTYEYFMSKWGAKLKLGIV